MATALRAAAVLTAMATAASVTSATTVYAAAPTPTAVAATNLNVRVGAAVWFRRVSTLRRGTPVTISCWVTGQNIAGGVSGGSDRWDVLVDGTVVSDAWVRRDRGVSRCRTATTGPPARTGVVVATGIPLRVRSGPAASSRRITILPHGTRLTLECAQRGSQQAGPEGITDQWDRLPDGTYVSDAWVHHTRPVPRCTDAAQPVAGPAMSTIDLAPGTPARVAAALRWALGQLATPYHLDGDCTDAHSTDPAHQCDCSSLVQMAYRAAGVRLPRTAAQQSHIGTLIADPSQLRPGDLLFVPGGSGTVSAPGHVGIYIRDGYVLDAPRAHRTVRLSPVTPRWLPGLTIRRPLN